MSLHGEIDEVVSPSGGIVSRAARRRFGASVLMAVIVLLPVKHVLADDRTNLHPLRAALVTAEMATDARLAQLRKSGYSAAVLMVGGADGSAAASDRQAIDRIGRAGLNIYYWIEIGRCPELAEAHPRWMASLQGHPEWRRFHKNFPQPKQDEVVKTYPWTPVFYREAFDAHLARIKQLLTTRPATKGIFLNDLQGAPSACGCGNPVCRWTTDYGPIVTATRMGDDAPAKFVAAVKRMAPVETRVIPVWTTECEEHDRAKIALCAGVGCYEGTCWKVYSRQLSPLASETSTFGALLLYKEFHQDGPEYQERAGWIGHALRHGFIDQPAKNHGATVATSRVIAVLQGWNVSPAEIEAQINQAVRAGAAGYVVAFATIDQSWQPRILKWR